ncbi:MFS general substrate transporter [Apiospora hydei]|uniref:MFS general substrate transporter n=1 Tax=Apiospora hydei TaxID=1337664 RepID=A0ABR1X0V5_9PEZI
MGDSMHKTTTSVDRKPSERSNGSITSSGQAAVLEADAALHRRLLWKRDIVLVPIMGVLYTLLFLDRTNIANARALGIGSPTGLEASLQMPSNGYNIALVIFYIPFVLAEIPANLILNQNKIRPGLFLGGQMALLGILGMCQGLAKSYGGLLAVRFLMEAALRFAWFFNFALAGPLFSGLLAYAIQNLEGTGGYAGWRWVFIIEGLMTVVISVPVIIFCPNFPHQAQSWFLKPAEREHVLAQLEASRGVETKGSASDQVSIWKVLIDWRIHLFTLCFFCCDITAASVSAFSPTILTELGWTNTVAQLMTMPVWASGIISSFLVTWLASRLNCRTPFVLGAILFQLVGWVIMRVYVPKAGVRYLALFLMSIGTFPQMPILMGWLSANLRGRKYLAVGMAWMIGFGNCANFVSSNIFIKAEAPRYVTGFTTGLAFTIVGFILVSCVCMLLVMKNKKREQLRLQMTAAERDSHDEVYFKFVL